jgi:hypothetical protein
MKRIGIVLGATAALLAGCSGMMGGSGWTTLIDGSKGMENFTVLGDGNWRAADGAIQADAKPSKDASYLITRQNYGDFQAIVEFWASDNANSGVYMRCQDRNKITDKSCYEANIFDQRPDPTYGTGAIVHIAPVKQPMPKAGGKWNTFDITLKGSRLTVSLNGQQTVDVTHDAFKSGPIALQYAAGTIKFRKVQVRPL